MLALLDAGPKHGYQLKAEFETALTAQGTLNAGQVYTTLDRLVRDALVEETDLAELDEPGADERRKPFRLTDAGRKVARAWFLDAAPAADRSRDELVSRVLLAVHTNAVDPVEVIDEQRRALVARLQEVRQQQRKVGDDLTAALILDAVASTVEADLGWLDRADARLRRLGAEPPTRSRLDPHRGAPLRTVPRRTS
jgi:DNA-binding PadR family transcriptional regulator